MDAMPLETVESGQTTEGIPLLPRILVVEDEPDQRSAIRDVLVYYGFQVDTAADGLEAMALALRGSYDVLISDIHLPGMFGIDLASCMGCLGRPPEVILITAYPEWYKEARAQNHVRVLRKPFGLRGLAEEVRDIVSKQRRRGGP